MDMQHTPIITVPVSGPIHATAWADPVVCFAQVGHELLHLHLDPSWTWIRSFTSSSLAMPPDHNSAFQTADDIQWNVSCAQPYFQSWAEPSTAHIHLGQPSVNTPSRAWPRNICKCRLLHCGRMCKSWSVTWPTATKMINWKTRTPSSNLLFLSFTTLRGDLKFWKCCDKCKACHMDHRRMRHKILMPGSCSCTSKQC